VYWFDGLVLLFIQNKLIVGVSRVFAAEILTQLGYRTSGKEDIEFATITALA